MEFEEAMKNMHPDKIAIMKELADNAKGKQLKDTAPLIMKATQKLKEKNLSFSPQESALLIEILTKDMSSEEKGKVEMMKNIMKNRGRR